MTAKQRQRRLLQLLLVTLRNPVYGARLTRLRKKAADLNYDSWNHLVDDEKQIMALSMPILFSLQTVESLSFKDWPTVSLSMKEKNSLSLPVLSTFMSMMSIDGNFWQVQQQTPKADSDNLSPEMKLSIPTISMDHSQTDEDFEWATPQVFNIPSLSFPEISMSMETSVDYTWNDPAEETVGSISMSMPQSGSVVLFMSDGDDALWNVETRSPSATPPDNGRFDWTEEDVSLSLSMSVHIVLSGIPEPMSIPYLSMSTFAEEDYYLWNAEETGSLSSIGTDESISMPDLSFSMSLHLSSMSVIEGVSEKDYLWNQHEETNAPSSSSTEAPIMNGVDLYWNAPDDYETTHSFSLPDIMLSTPEVSLSMPDTTSELDREDFDWAASDSQEDLSLSMFTPDVSSIEDWMSIPESSISVVFSDDFRWNAEAGTNVPSSTEDIFHLATAGQGELLLSFPMPENVFSSPQLSLSLPRPDEEVDDDYNWATPHTIDETSLSMAMLEMPSIPELSFSMSMKENYDRVDNLWIAEEFNASSMPSSSIVTGQTSLEFDWTMPVGNSFSLSMSNYLGIPEFSLSMPNSIISKVETDDDKEYFWGVDGASAPSTSVTGAPTLQDLSWAISEVEAMSLLLPMNVMSLSIPDVLSSMPVNDFPTLDDWTWGSFKTDSPSLIPTEPPSLLRKVVPTFSPSSMLADIPSLKPSVEPSASPAGSPAIQPSSPPAITSPGIVSLIPSVSITPNVISSSPSQSALPSWTHSSVPSTSGQPTKSSVSMPFISNHSSSPSASTQPTVPSSSASPSSTYSTVPSVSGVPTKRVSSPPSISILPTSSLTLAPSIAPTISSSSVPSSSLALTPDSPVINLVMHPTEKPKAGSIPSQAPSLLPTSPDSAKIVDSVTEKPTRNPTEDIYPVLFPTPLPSAIRTSIDEEFMMTGFSTNATMVFDNLSEPMDEATTSIFEQVVTGFLIDTTLMADDQSHQVFISSVDVIHQSVIEDDDNERIHERDERSLSTKALHVMINVVGEVEPEAPDSYIASITMMIQDHLDDEEGHKELATRLAKESTYFDSYYSQQNELVVSEAQNRVPEDEVTGSRWIVLIVGGCVAVAALIGSLFYMERRFNNANGRRAIRRDGFEPYHLRHASADDMEKETGGRKGAGEQIPALASPKSVNESRLKSVLDFDDEKSSVSNSEATSQHEEEKRETLNLSLDQLKEAVKKRDSNIFIFTDDKRPASIANGDESLLELKATVSSLSNPSQVDELVSPSPRFRYLPGDPFDYHHAEKLIGDQFDARAILTPYTPRVGKGDGQRTPRTRTVYSFGSPISALSRKDKLFDVTCPSGPLGIIIDTTPDGPMIHSLKPTSQLLGLVNPGDLIVGLDGVDTRNMTAATFTRLMAKRSQAERKITLLKGLAPLTPRTPR